MCEKGSGVKRLLVEALGDRQRFLPWCLSSEGAGSRRSVIMTYLFVQPSLVPAGPPPPPPVLGTGSSCQQGVPARCLVLEGRDTQAGVWSRCAEAVA